MGKTYPYQQPPQVLEKHPHVRGEDGSPQDDIVGVLETPPRAWGRQSCGHHNGDRHRNTPTCVGKTLPCTNGSELSRKHPHVRGEDAKRGDGRWTVKETPPRAWGRPGLGGETVKQWRNTPTCVGKTDERVRRYRADEKHPHVRGEDLSLFLSGRGTSETPPRAWGRLTPIPVLEKTGRNTPTCVGKTHQQRGR